MFVVLWARYGHQREKTRLGGFVKNKVPDQPAHPCCLISAFFIHGLESIISELDTRTSKISIFYLVSVAEQTDLSLTGF